MGAIDDHIFGEVFLEYWTLQSEILVQVGERPPPVLCTACGPSPTSVGLDASFKVYDEDKANSATSEEVLGGT